MLNVPLFSSAQPNIAGCPIGQTGEIPARSRQENPATVVSSRLKPEDLPGQKNRGV